MVEKTYIVGPETHTRIIREDDRAIRVSYAAYAYGQRRFKVKNFRSRIMNIHTRIMPTIRVSCLPYAYDTRLPSAQNLRIQHPIRVY